MKFGQVRTLICWCLLPFFWPAAVTSQNQLLFAKLTECIHSQQDTFFLHTSDPRVLAFDESAVLRAFLAGYQIRPDSLWLNRTLFHVQSVFPKPENGKLFSIFDKNASTGQTEPSPEFYAASYYVPILRFYLQLAQTPPENLHLRQQFAGLVRSIEKILIKWKPNKLRWQDWPHHQYSALGTVFCLMHRLTQLPDPPLNHPEQQEWYLTSLEMATFLKQHLKVDTQTAAYYWYLDANESRIENINQGNTTVEFILAAKENGIVFDDIDLFRLLNTMRYKIWNQEEVRPEFRYCIDGSYSPDSGYQLQTWVFFGLLDQRLQQALQKNVLTWLNEHPLLQGRLRGGKAACTVANLALIEHKINSTRSEPIH